MPASILCDIPPSLRQADHLLTEYGRWATAWRARSVVCGSVERRYRRHLDRQESLAAFLARRVPANPLMPVHEALLCQRALARVPERERVILSILYVQSRLRPAHMLLRLMRIPPSLCRIRHEAGLRMFDNLHRALVAHERALEREVLRTPHACEPEKLVATIAATS